MSLFASFSKVVSEALLFVCNVKTISIFVKEETGCEMQLIHHVHKHCISEPDIEPNSLHMFSIFNGNQHSGMDKDQFLKKLSKLVDKNLPWKCQKIVMTEQSSSKKYVTLLGN